MKLISRHTLSSLQDSTDIELITAVSVDRSDDALEVLYRRHRPLLRTIISRVLNGDSDVEDVLQDVFIQVWEQAGSYSEEKGQLLGWLITLSRRRALDRVRRNCSYKQATDRFEVASQTTQVDPTATFVVDREVSHNELSREIKTQIQKLPEAQREAVKLAFFDGLSQREVAKQLSVPLGTIKTRLELGIRKLGRALTPQLAA